MLRTNYSMAKSNIRICIDNIGDGFIVSGKFYLSESLMPIVFYNIGELFHELDRYLKRADNRYIGTFDSGTTGFKYSTTFDINEYETKLKNGKEDTFVVNIIPQDSNIWNGCITQLSRGHVLYFNSQMELLKLMVEAIALKEKNLMAC